MTLISLKLLGPVQISWATEPAPRFRSPTAIALLGYLVAEARQISREMLASFFWPDAPEGQALGELRRCLHNLSSILPGCIQADRQIVYFEAGTTAQVDLDLFRRLQAQGDAHSLTAAVAVYRGELMEGLHLAGCPDFDLWLLAEREHWRAESVRVLRQLLVHYSARGDYAEGIGMGRRILALDPWNEETHRQVMLLLARIGQHSAALAQYESCRRILSEELAVEPGAETIALYTRIKAATALRSHNLPTQPTPFVGREVELADIRQMLANPACRLLTLVGPAGIGKSRLAIEAARRAVGEGSRLFLHGVTYVPLAGLESAALLPSTLASALGITFHARTPQQTQLLSFLAGKEVLLVLDNYEPLLPETALLAAILTEAPEVKILVTTRELLNLREEWLFDVEELAYPSGTVEMGKLSSTSHEETVAWLRSYDAVRLFEESARRIQRHFSLAGEAVRVVQICQQVEGMPLALELAAGQLRSLTCADLAMEIAGNLDILASSQRNTHRRHLSVRVLFESSWAALNWREQQLLRRLPIFRSGFTQEAAMMVADGTLATLTVLVEKSFLRLSTSGRYSLHALVRQFAAEKLNAAPTEHEAIQAKHGAYYANFLQQRESSLQGPDQKQIMAEITAEVDNVRVAWRWAVDTGDWGVLTQALTGLSRFYEGRGWHQEANDVFTYVLTTLAPQAGEMTLEQRVTWARLHAHAALPRIRMGQIPQARVLAERAVGELRHLESGNALAYALTCLGIAIMYGGELPLADSILTEAVAIYRRNERRGELVHTLSALSSARIRAGMYDQSLQTLHEGLVICRAIADRRGEAAFLQNIATTHMIRGDLPLAESYFEQCLPICDETGFQYVKQIALENLGELAIKNKDFTRAQAFCEESIAIARELNDHMNLARTLSLLGVALAEGGTPDVGWHRLREALQTAQATNSAPTIFAVLDGVASWLVISGRREEAIELLNFLSQHSAAEQQHRDHAAQLLTELGANVTPETKSPYTLDEVITSFLLR